MKKILLLVTLAIGMMACSTDDAPTTPTTPVDCNCDRVVEVNTFNVVGTPQNPSITYHSVYITINDCTQIQRQKTHNTIFAAEIPKVGDCK
jgi:hypothetical protein